MKRFLLSDLNKEIAEAKDKIRVLQEQRLALRRGTSTSLTVQHVPGLRSMAESQLAGLAEEESVLENRVRDLERERDSLRIDRVELQGWLTLGVAAAGLIVAIISILIAVKG